MNNGVPIYNDRLFDPNNLLKREYDSILEETILLDPPYKEIKEDEFSIGINSEVNTIQCKICNGKEFNVGIGSYYTAIRCINCKYEICVHEG